MNRGLLAAAATIGGYYAYRALKPRYDFRGKHVLITGGSRGLGLILARKFAAQGARLSLCSRHADELARAGAELSGKGVKVVTYAGDLTQEPEVKAFVAAGVRGNGPVDVLVHNAGVIQAGPLDEMTADDFRESLAIHLWAGLYAAREVIPAMQARKSGRIVNIASFGGRVSVPHLIPYCVGKHALVGLSDGMRAELAKDGIVVTTVEPGLMRTGQPPERRVQGAARRGVRLVRHRQRDPRHEHQRRPGRQPDPRRRRRRRRRVGHQPGRQVRYLRPHDVSEPDRLTVQPDRRARATRPRRHRHRQTQRQGLARQAPRNRDDADRPGGAGEQRGVAGGAAGG